MHSPKLLILDEPTSGLDPIMQKVFHDILKAEKELGFKATKTLEDMMRDGWNYQKNKIK